MKIIGDGGHAKVIKSFATGDGCIIAVGNNFDRKREAAHYWPEPYQVLIHPSAIVAPDVVIGIGTVIMAGAVIQPGTRIGKHCIINTGATVDHDCVIEDYAHIAPGAHLCGHVHIGEGALVGVGVGIAPGCKIPAWSLVKARRLEIVPLQSNG